ncbi:hypothetical protein [Streptomyces spiralis]
MAQTRLKSCRIRRFVVAVQPTGPGHARVRQKAGGRADPMHKGVQAAMHSAVTHAEPTGDGRIGEADVQQGEDLPVDGLKRRRDRP